jgi:hypothetical protein
MGVGTKKKIAFSFKLLILNGLLGVDPGSSRQILESKGLVGKFFKNKELAVVPSLIHYAG